MAVRGTPVWRETPAINQWCAGELHTEWKLDVQFGYLQVFTSSAMDPNRDEEEPPGR